MGVLPPEFSWTKRDRSVATLPAAQGNVPLFVDKLTWPQIGELLFRWSSSSGKYEVFSKAPEILADIHSFRDIKKYATMGLVYGKVKLKNFLKKNI
jgi:hypothetical protein